MPKQGRWLLANVKPGGTGVQSVVARPAKGSEVESAAKEPTG